MAVIGVNPSTATETEDDPTIRRCIRFAADSGHGGLVMLNLFAWRATDIGDLVSAAYGGRDVVGPGNDNAILLEGTVAETVVCAWGPSTKVPAPLQARFAEVPRMLAGRSLHVLALTKGGHPGHPLYLPTSCRPTPWSPR